MDELDLLETLALVARSEDISQFEVFRRAMARWEGAPPSPQALERSFGRYLRSGEVPVAVRHYLRQWLDQHPAAAAARRLEVHQQRRRQGLVWGALLVAILGALFIRP
ncbi:MAG: hypothetical protein ACFCBW_06500 [Candidatus Competibacterales bacterium]